MRAVRSRRRLVLGTVAVVLAIAAGGVLVNRFVLQAEWWQLDQKVTSDPAPQLSAIGPPPGPMAATWQLATPVRHSGLSQYDQVAHAVVQGQLLVVSGQGIDVRDARTGRPRWHYQRSGWVVRGWTTTQRDLVVYLERLGHRDTHLLVGLDAVSGRLRWRDSTVVPAATERATLRWPSGSGVVLTTAGRVTLRGQDARTGGQLWRAALPAGCLLPEAAPYTSDSSEALAVVVLDCDGQSQVLALDPRTGRTRWSKESKSADPGVAVRGDVTAVFDGTALRAYDRTGRELLSRTGADVCPAMCPIEVTGGHLVFAYQTRHDKGARDGARSPLQRLEAVDLASGQTVWRHDVPGYAALTVAGGRLYALRFRVADTLLPAGVDIIEPATGNATTVPAPFVAWPGPEGVRPWLGAGGGLLYVATPEAAPRPFGTARLVALRGGARGTGPAELGGVPVAQWPDACALFKGTDLLAKQDLAKGDPAKAKYATRSEYAQVGKVRLPRPVSCTYEAQGRPDKEQDVASATVTVQWVADSPSTAAAMFAGLRATQYQARQLMHIGDEAYELGSSSATVVVRVDRYLIAVNTQSPGAGTRLAKVAAGRLRDLTR